MTDATMDVRAMEAGRDTDVRVAVDVMRWSEAYAEYRAHSGVARVTSIVDDGQALRLLRYRSPKRVVYDIYPGRLQEVPRYSTDIAAAMDVAEHVRRAMDCHYSLAHGASGDWAASFHGCASDPDLDYGVGDTHGNARADTAPLAICRAALLAVNAGGGE